MTKRSRFDYFDMFERQAELAVREADLLVEAVENFSGAENLEDIISRAHAIEHEADEIIHRVSDTIATDFITPIEREDIIGLAQLLDDVIDFTEDVIQHFYMYDVHFIHHDAIEFAYLVKKSCEAIRTAMKDFRNFKKSKQIKQLIVNVNTYEEAADRLYISVIRKLYIHDCENPVRVLVWSQIFDHMERCCDGCECVANAMSTILLKNV